MPATGWRRQWDSALTSYYLLLGTTGLLLIFGLVMVFSATAVTSIAAGEGPYAQVLSQVRFAVLGLPVMVAASRIPLRWYRRLAWPALFLAIGLQALTLVPGVALARGTRSAWIGYGGFVMQPAELGKLALALWLGVVLGRKYDRLGHWHHVIFPVIPFGVLMTGLVLAGGDIGTGLVFVFLIAGALWVAGAPSKLFTLAVLATSALIWFVFILGEDSGKRISRILATFDPNCDVTSLCYQTQHGLFALGTGGIFGVGLGSSREKWNYLPEAHNDFIFAIIGEELGLLGALMVLALLAALGIGMYRVIRRHQDPTAKIATAAVAAWVVGQGLINIGVVIGLFPVIGLPLPLVSAGGSALITTLAGLGMVMSFARTEPGAPEALAARTSVARRTYTVIERSRRAPA